MNQIHILAISGSPRRGSGATSLFRAISGLVPDHVHVTICESLIELPHFSPELDTNEPPLAITDIREMIRDCDGVIICTPEYAFSMPSVLKNLLEWDVSSADLYRKPTLAIGISPNFGGGAKALESLLIVLGAIGARIPEGGTLAVKNFRKRMSEHGEISDPSLTEELRDLLEKLLLEVETRQAENREPNS